MSYLTFPATADIVTAPLIPGYEFSILVFQGRCVLCRSGNIHFLNSGKSYVIQNGFLDGKAHAHQLLVVLLLRVLEVQEENAPLESEVNESCSLLADGRIIIIIIIIIIFTDKASYLESQPSLEDYARLHPFFASLHFAPVNYLHSIVVSLPSKPQPAR
jgi:hypothetical protein